MEVDEKLSQFLSIHSMNLTATIKNYLKKSKKGELPPHE